MGVYDLLIIGGGPGGYLAGERAGHAGLKTAVFEERALGGVCLNEGCIPSKSLLYSAKMLDHARGASKYGVNLPSGEPTIDQDAVISRKNTVVRTLVRGIASQMKKEGVTVVNASAVIAGRAPEGFRVRAGDEEYVGKKLIIATGSEAVVPPIPGVREGMAEGRVMTNREILDLRVIPEKLAVVGGGVIGLEMASYFRSAGSDVTVIEMADKIAGPTDAEISGILRRNYEKKGVRFCLGSRVTSVEKGAVHFSGPQGDQTAECSAVLVSVGRRPVTSRLGLETLGVYTERGAVVTGECMRTNVHGVYAVGDVNGKTMLAHKAYREADVAVNHILGKRDVIRYSAIPSVIYTNPEVASVGETEDGAKAKGIRVKTAKLPMSYAGRYLAEGGGDGICKVVTDASTDRLIGVHMIGSYCSEIIYGAALMIESQYCVDDLKELVFPHPTVSEIIRDTLFEIK